MAVRTRRLATVAGTVLLAGACASGGASLTGSSGTPPPKLSSLQKHDPGLRLPVGPLAPGSYYPTFFTRLVFTVPAGWSSTPQDFPDTVVLYRRIVPDPAAREELDIVRPSAVFHGTCLHRRGLPDVLMYGPGSRAVRPAPRDMVPYLSAYPFLREQHRSSTSVGGRPATRIDATVAGVPNGCINAPAFVGMAALFGMPGNEKPGAQASSGPAAPFTVIRGKRVRIQALSLGGFPVLVSMEAPAASFDRFALEAQRVVDSIRFG